MSEQRDEGPIQCNDVTVEVHRCLTATSVVHVSGELRRDASAAVGRVVASELRRAPSSLALDLSDVTEIDSVGVALLVSAAMQAGESNISFCLVGVRGNPVGTAIADADLTELFEIVSAVSDT
jgi:anti-sigma B factor antagonist